MRSLIWVHEDALGYKHSVFQRAGQNAKAVFVWDRNDFQKRGHSLKKLVFIYECLQDMGIEIISGQTKEVLEGFCKEGHTLYFAEPRNPELLNLIAPLQRKYNLTMIENTPLGGVKVQPEMKRFFRYWNKARATILKNKAGT